MRYRPQIWKYDVDMCSHVDEWERLEAAKKTVASTFGDRQLDPYTYQHMLLAARDDRVLQIERELGWQVSAFESHQSKHELFQAILQAGAKGI